jgi:hypothetical protein
MDGARDGFWGYHHLALLHLVAKISHVGADVDELTYCLHRPIICDWQERIQSLLTYAVPSCRTT